MRTQRFRPAVRALLLVLATTVAAQAHPPAKPQSAATCRIEPVNYKGWNAQQLSNSWVQLVFVPQNGGRLIQVTFAGPPPLFPPPPLAGKYLPPPHHQW